MANECQSFGGTYCLPSAQNFSYAPSRLLHIYRFCLEAEDALCGGDVCRPAYVWFVKAAEDMPGSNATSRSKQRGRN